MTRPPWQLWVDSGGTFTDCLGIDPEGAAHRVKVLTSGRLRARIKSVPAPRRIELEHRHPVSPELLVGWRLRVGPPGAAELFETTIAAAGDAGSFETSDPIVAGVVAGADAELETGEIAPVVGARLVTATPVGAEFPELRVRLATTLGTNALLERRGRPIALFVTRGFGDLLEIGDQRRPDLFALDIVKPKPLHREAIEVDERLDARGRVVEPLDLAALDGPAEELLARGIRAAAVALVHSFRNPAHEEAVAERLLRRGFEHVSISARLSSRIKILPRAQTAVADAYLSSAIGVYLAAVAGALAGSTVHVLTSAAALVRADRFQPKDSLLSGPAGGALGAAAVGRRCGAPAVLAFDMGGTSTDVTRWAGELPYRSETRVGDARLLSPSVAVETVAAGGGSICSFDGRRLRVGPRSAGARPGPACYGSGGPLTITDVNLLLGRLSADRFPFAVSRRAARRRLEAIRARVLGAAPPGAEPASEEEILAGFLRIANETMAAAVRRTSVRLGYRPADHWLVAFGGAGPQHACGLAKLLGISRVVVPRDAAILSALGLGVARPERFAERQVLAPLREVEARLPDLLEELGRQAASRLEAEGVRAGDIVVRQRRLFLRLEGQESTLEVDAAPEARPQEAFSRRYRELFGYEPGERPVEVESVRVVASGPPSGAPLPVRKPAPGSTEARTGTLFDTSSGEWTSASILERGAMALDARQTGPALIVEDHSVTVVERGWTAQTNEFGDLRLIWRTG